MAKKKYSKKALSIIGGAFIFLAIASVAWASIYISRQLSERSSVAPNAPTSKPAAASCSGINGRCRSGSCCTGLECSPSDGYKCVCPNSCPYGCHATTTGGFECNTCIIGQGSCSNNTVINSSDYLGSSSGKNLFQCPDGTGFKFDKNCATAPGATGGKKGACYSGAAKALKAECVFAKPCSRSDKNNCNFVEYDPKVAKSNGYLCLDGNDLRECCNSGYKRTYNGCELFSTPTPTKTPTPKVVKICTPGTKKCSGTYSYTCNSTGTAWGSAINCSPYKVCTNGSCVTPYL